ncbi:MAG TPA: HAMP domain-containing sensor histidine kinase [Ideonella sp.]|uniref:sensor histidine kinase n=1 Tax=Ideonella sp. TaxID=1929293 RepID=UPI002BA47987|nr:HAMP domain-containing sensor histidine kinase [Ideonella sp.]HSI51831.1 HAMP domain-containing sensor histidine kinase [Ideonella sp.]
MKSLYLRIWLTVVAALALFALVSGWLLQSHLAQEHARAEAAMAERMAGWGTLIQNSLPERDAPGEDQAKALQEWSTRLRMPLALSDSRGKVIAQSEAYARLLAEGRGRPVMLQLDDGRKLWIMRPWRDFRGPHGEMDDGPRPGEGPGGPGRPDDAATAGGPQLPPGPPPDGLGGPPGEDRGSLVNRRIVSRTAMPFGWDMPGLPRDWPASVGLLVLLMLLFIAVAAGAYPVVRGLTRRLEALKRGVEAFGAGALDHRVKEEGRDEVAALATSFNQAAARLQTLMQANQSLLANASHELRSPLARLKMAVSMFEDDAPPALKKSLRREINVNIGELDALVEEVLLSSRLEAGAAMDLGDPVDLLGLLAEEGARVQAGVTGDALIVKGSDRLLRRAVRNLLENARRYGGAEISATLHQEAGGGRVLLRVCDRGPGVPEEERERIFEPFYRMAGHAEREGGVGLGLALVRQIARRHGGEVSCLPHEGGGSCFMITLPADRLLVLSPRR